ncbi:hypothetical protein RRF57_013237 [Xylaria bambusicola]|uniref:Cell wall protein PhiA n=1 Tax=Xylaria bambusicola TaxID=326684 RepID=A0AAN7ZBB8_9PEZI
MFSNALSFAFLAGAAMASRSTPTPSSTIGPDEPFGLMSLRSASPIHFGQFQAALSSIFLFLPSQNATCDDGQKPTNPNYATFALSEDGGLYLYANSATPQQLFVDRSGMGQGKLGYTTGAQPAPRNSERTAFSIDEYGDLSFNGAGFIACPNSIDGAWTIWVDAGFANPGGNSDCLGLAARTVKIEEGANSCSYTS